MSSITKVSKIDPSFPFAGRAAQREIVRGLNFTIVNLMSAKIRERIRQEMAAPIVNPGPNAQNNPGTNAVNLEPLLEKYGNTLDRRNEHDAARDGIDHSDELREEQGMALVAADPTVLAGKLKVMRDAFAANLEQFATPMVNVIDPKGGMILNPYEVAEPLMVTLMKQLERPVNVNRDMAMAQAAALGLNVNDVIRIQQRQQEAGLRFLKTNKKELVLMFETLEAFKPAEGMQGDANRRVHEDDDKYEATLESVDDLELEIPEIHRARMYVNAERGFFYERDRWINAVLKRHPEGATNVKILDGCRAYLHKEYDALMANPRFYAAISTAVQGGATWPTLLDLPEPATPASLAA